MTDSNLSEEERKAALLKKISKASDEMKEKQKNNKILDVHMSVLRNREDPYQHIGLNKTNRRFRRIVILMAVGVCSLFLLTFVVLNNKNQSGLTQ
jgi:hypothetical protein